MFPIAKIQLLFGFSKQFVEFWHAEHLHIRQGKRICHAELTQIFPFSKVHMGTYPVCTNLDFYFSALSSPKILASFFSAVGNGPRKRMVPSGAKRMVSGIASTP